MNILENFSGTEEEPEFMKALIDIVYFINVGYIDEFFCSCM
jgi:hypothetical protein